MNIRKAALILFTLMFVGCVAAAIHSSRPAHEVIETAVHTTQDPSIQAATKLPKYDSREKNLLTPIKKQGPTETCWAFSANGAIEAALKKSGKGTYDLSEDNLIFGVSYKTGYDVGGNQNRAVSYLASGKGPVTEDQDPFDGSMSRNAKPAYILTDALYLKNDKAILKEAIVKYGAIACGAYVPTGGEGKYLNTKTLGYYCPDIHTPSHNVDIVGWDDTYKKENFTMEPPTDGAWIVRNSYGENWADHGYYYVSYNDTAIGTEAVAYAGFTSPNTYSAIYQNDPAGQTAHRGFKDSQAWMANVYSKQESKSKLDAVGFYTRGDNTSYSIYIADNYTSPDDLKRGRELKSGTIDQAGYHTVNLNQPETLNGSTFAIIVKLNTPGEPFPIATEEPTEKTQGVTANKGESFVSHTGSSWTDFADSVKGGNVCLKGYVKR